MVQKILVFEFITGGGLSQQQLPKSLVEEGLLMLKALVNDLSLLSDIHITVTLDWRIKAFELPKNSQFVRVSREQHIDDLLPDLIENADLIWPIAPEMDGVLQKITQRVEQKSKRLLNSSSQAIAICSDKLVTIQCLNSHNITAVAGIRLDKFTLQYMAPWVIKPRDGVGCLNSHFVSNQSELLQIKNQITGLSDYLIQPYIDGVVLSLSCLFKEGKAWLLCCNEQLVSVSHGQFKLEACIVNSDANNNDIYQKLINHLAAIMPGLYGYVGIDLIKPKQGSAMVLEINPRLTTSYVGINQAIGFNVAKAVIEMSKIDPIIEKTCNKKIRVSP